MNNLLVLFCNVDDFCKKFILEFEKSMLEVSKKRQKPCRLSVSEIMTIIIYFHQMRFRDFKTYYIQYVQKHMQKDFPKLVSYNRFIERLYFKKVV